MHAKIEQVISSQATEQLKEVAKGLFVSEAKEATLLLDNVLEVLMNRMPESEFVQFCETF